MCILSTIINMPMRNDPGMAPDKNHGRGRLCYKRESQVNFILLPGVFLFDDKIPDLLCGE